MNSLESCLHPNLGDPNTMTMEQIILQQVVQGEETRSPF